jgi:hypothetical protein
MTKYRWIALSGAAVVGIVVTVAFVAQLVHQRFLSNLTNANYVTVLFVVVAGVSLIGLLAASRAPASGALLVVAAATTGAGYWRFSTRPWPAAIGFAIAACTPLLALHAALLHGDGLRARAHHALIAAEVVIALVGLSALSTADAGDLDRWFAAGPFRQYIRNPAVFWHSPAFARRAYEAWWILLIVAALVFTVARIAAWRREPPAERRRNALVVVGAIVWSVVLAIAGAMIWIRRSTDARQELTDFGAIMLPALGAALVAAAIGWVELVRPRLERVHDGEIEMRTIEPEDASALKRLLADVLATPSVDVVFATGPHWVDDTGRPIALPEDERRVTIVRRLQEPVAAVIHDPDVSFEAVELAARLVAGHIDAQRATALARARAEAVRAATGRLVRAGDRAATDVGIELVTGPIARIDALLARMAREPDAAHEAAVALRDITTEVRTISHGVFPRDIDKGLGAVLSVPGTPARRLPASVEMTVYLLAQHDGATIHDDGEQVAVACTTAIPPSLAERVSALGGSIDGTVAQLPVEG